MLVAQTYFVSNTVKIKKELLEELLLGCNKAYPNEFFALLASESKKIIDNYVVVPLFYQTENSVSYRTDLLPLGFKIAGTIHSHPSGSNLPSNADLNSFIKQGIIHFIVKYPYRKEDVACYDYQGKKIQLLLV